MTEDVVWSVNVPLVKAVVGRAAAKAEIERQNTIATGLLPGSEIRNIAATGDVVFTERLDVFKIGGQTYRLHINGVFELRGDKIAAWRDYWDGVDLAQQLDIDAKLLYES